VVCVLAGLGAWEDTPWKASVSRADVPSNADQSSLLCVKMEEAQTFCHLGVCSCALSKDGTFLFKTVGCHWTSRNEISEIPVGCSALMYIWTLD